MQEEAELDVARWVVKFLELFAQHSRHEHKVVVVNPDKVVILDVLRDLLGKDTVGLAIRIPGRFVEGDLAGVVMEQRPENGV